MAASRSCRPRLNFYPGSSPRSQIISWYRSINKRPLKSRTFSLRSNSRSYESYFFRSTSRSLCHSQTISKPIKRISSLGDSRLTKTFISPTPRFKRPRALRMRKLHLKRRDDSTYPFLMSIRRKYTRFLTKFFPSSITSPIKTRLTKSNPSYIKRR